VEWVNGFVHSLHEAIQCVWRWEVVTTVDPMTVLLRVDLAPGNDWGPYKKNTRQLLKTWAKENECEYRKSSVHKNILVATIHLRHLSRKKNQDPFKDKSSSG